MSVSETSIKAYYEELPKIGNRQRQVMEALRHRNMTNRDIAKATGMPINAVTPRCKELRHFGLVEEKGRVVDPETRKTVTLWGLKTQPAQQMEIF